MTMSFPAGMTPENAPGPAGVRASRTTPDPELPVKEWRAREAAAFALYPIMQREGLEDLQMIAAGELAQTVVDTYLRVLGEPLPEGWKKYV